MHTATVVGVMKMGNTVPRVGLEPTSLAFQASVLPLHHIGLPLMPPLYPRLQLLAILVPPLPLDGELVVGICYCLCREDSVSTAGHYALTSEDIAQTD